MRLVNVNQEDQNAALELPAESAALRGSGRSYVCAGTAGDVCCEPPWREAIRWISAET